MLPVSPKVSQLRLDTSVHAFATSAAGRLLVGADGNPITIAQDTMTGRWWAKVQLHMPWATNDSQLEKDRESKALEFLQGAVHVACDDERFRGVWMPLEEAKADAVDTSRPELRQGSSPPALAAPSASVRTPAKTAAKKSAKRTPAEKAAAKAANKEKSTKPN